MHVVYFFSRLHFATLHYYQPLFGNRKNFCHVARKISFTTGVNEQAGGTLCSNSYLNLSQSALQFWKLHYHDDLPKGQGITIAILDSGIQANHDMLTFEWEKMVEHNYEPKLLLDFSENFCDIGNRKDIYDEKSHGTRCTGIAAGLPFKGYIDRENSNPEVIQFVGGVAPKSRVIMCKVCCKDKSPTPSAVFKALQHLNELQRSGKCKIDVVSMSLGFRKDEINGSDEDKIQKEINLLANERTICVASAGNDFQTHTSAVVFPASCQNVIAVGSHDTEGTPSWFSPQNKVDCLTLGENIIAPTIGASKKRVEVCAGTSEAAAAVAGLVALVIEIQVKHNASFSFNRIKLLIERMRNEDDSTRIILRPTIFLKTAPNNPVYFAWVTE